MKQTPKSVSPADGAGKTTDRRSLIRGAGLMAVGMATSLFGATGSADAQHKTSPGKQANGKSVICLLEIPIKPGSEKAMFDYWREFLPGTRGFDGCLGITVMLDRDKPTIMMIHQRWETRQHHQRYIRWRIENGVVAKILTMSPAKRLYPRYYDVVGL